MTSQTIRHNPDVDYAAELAKALERDRANDPLAARTRRLDLCKIRRMQLIAERKQRPAGADCSDLDRQQSDVEAERIALLVEHTSEGAEPSVERENKRVLARHVLRTFNRAWPERQAVPSPWISVEELAYALRQTVGTTRRLLERDLVPGARRKTPGQSGSPWLIPSAAPARYLEAHTSRGVS